MLELKLTAHPFFEQTLNIDYHPLALLSDAAGWVLERVSALKSAFTNCRSRIY